MAGIFNYLEFPCQYWEFAVMAARSKICYDCLKFSKIFLSETTVYGCVTLCEWSLDGSLPGLCFWSQFTFVCPTSSILNFSVRVVFLWIFISAKICQIDVLIGLLDWRDQTNCIGKNLLFFFFFINTWILRIWCC